MKPKQVWRYHQLLHGFLAIGQLPRVSRQSRLSGDNEMIPWPVRALREIRGVLGAECRYSREFQVLYVYSGVRIPRMIISIGKMFE